MRAVGSEQGDPEQEKVGSHGENEKGGDERELRLFKEG